MGWAQLMHGIRELDRKFAWSFIGVVLAVIFGGMTIYGQFFADLNPHLKYEILANAPVLDVREDITKLSVLFDGIDIRKQRESLCVMTIRILNDSDKDILKGYYDQNDPLGIHISGGKIIRADLLSASNPYLEKQLVPAQSNENTLSFPDVILEAKEFFVVKLLVLHPENTNPEIHPIGKIAGIRRIAVAEVYRQEPAPSLLWRVFAGGIVVQGFRLISYSVAMVATLALFLGAALLLDSMRARRAAKARKKFVKEFKRYANTEILPQEESILYDFTARGAEFLPSLLQLTSDSKALESNYALAMKEAKAAEEAKAAHERWKRERRAILEHERPKPSPAEVFRHRIGYYLEKGLIIKTEPGPTVNAHMRDVLQLFADFLRKKGRLPGPSDAGAARETPTIACSDGNTENADEARRTGDEKQGTVHSSPAESAMNCSGPMREPHTRKEQQ